MSLGPNGVTGQDRGGLFQNRENFPNARISVEGVHRTVRGRGRYSASRMLRAMLFSLLVLAGCRHDTDPPPLQPKEGDLPPLPPSSGTPVGYLLDNAAQLK